MSRLFRSYRTPKVKIEKLDRQITNQSLKLWVTDGASLHVENEVDPKNWTG